MSAEEDVQGRLEVALARAEELEAMYASLVGQLPAITYTEALDTHDTLSVSPQVEDLLGYSQEEWMSDPRIWEGILHPDDHDWVVAACDEANHLRKPFRIEYRMIARDGHVIWVRDEAEIVSGSQGQPLCWQGVMVDVTARKTAEKSSRTPPLE
jgi:PAS domain S-box-containing protein